MSHGGRRANAGRPRLPEQAAAPATIDERATQIQALLDGSQFRNDYKALRLVFIRKTRIHVGHKAARLIKEYAGEEDEANEALQSLQNLPKAVTKEDALSILLHVDLSRHQYQTLRTVINSSAQFRNLIPAYELVRLYKATCSPIKDVDLYTERRAEVRLQELLNHTAERAVLSNADNIQASLTQRRGRVECEFLLTWGMDGASEYTQYQQRHEQTENKGKSDKALFAVVVNPLVLQTKRRNPPVLWRNPAAQSHLFVRPLILEFEKETEVYVKGMKAYVDSQIHQLQPHDVVLDDGTILRIRFRLLASMIDGKVFCYFVNKPFSSCPICNADMNDLRTRYAECVGTARFWPNIEALIYGLQVLHAWINFTNHLMKIPLRIARDEAESDATDAGLCYDDRKRIGKEAWNARLAQMQDDFRRDDLHLGMTVTGNFARVLFGPRRDLFERVTGIDRRIIDRFRIILICVNTTRYYLKPKEFQDFCNDTRNLYLQLYPEYPLTPTIHKILEHSVQVQQAMGQKLGEVSEGAAEATHRIRKEIRRFRARKTSKLDNLTDIMDRCLHLSDPKLSSKYSTRVTKFRDARRRHALGQIPQEAQNLLEMNGDLPPPVVTAEHPTTREGRGGRNRRQTPDENLGLAAEDEDHQDREGNNEENADNGDDSEHSDGEDNSTDEEFDADLGEDDLSYEGDIFVDE